MGRCVRRHSSWTPPICSKLCRTQATRKRTIEQWISTDETYHTRTLMLYSISKDISECDCSCPMCQFSEPWLVTEYCLQCSVGSCDSLPWTWVMSIRTGLRSSSSSGNINMARMDSDTFKLMVVEALSDHDDAVVEKLKKIIMPMFDRLHDSLDSLNKSSQQLSKRMYEKDTQIQQLDRKVGTLKVKIDELD